MLAFINTESVHKLLVSMTNYWRGHYLSCPQTIYWGYVPPLVSTPMMLTFSNVHTHESLHQQLAKHCRE